MYACKVILIIFFVLECVIYTSMLSLQKLLWMMNIMIQFLNFATTHIKKVSLFDREFNIIVTCISLLFFRNILVNVILKLALPLQFLPVYKGDGKSLWPKISYRL